MTRDQRSTTREQDPDRLDRLLQEQLERARAAEDGSGPEAARQLLGAAPEALQQFGMYHYALGALSARAGDLEAAVQALERAVALDPQVAEFRGNLGAALLQGVQRAGPERLAGNKAQAALGRALHLLEEAAAERPKLAEVYSNLGLARSLAGQQEAALAALERALAIEPRHLDALYNKAAVLRRLDRREECLECLDSCLRIDGSFAPARESRERLLRQMKDTP